MTMSNEMQETIAKWALSHGPFFVLFVVLMVVMVYESREDRKAQVYLVEHMREIDQARLSAITDTLARVAEACDRDGALR